MFFATPIWLLALIPWMALAVWMLWGQRERVGVPFLALWRDGDARPTRRSAVRPPPLAIVLLVLSLLLAILAAASPTIGSSTPGTVTILVDRGITMSARDGNGYRYQRAAERVAPHMNGPIEVFAVPRYEVLRFDGIGSLPPTAVDTSAELEQAAIRLLVATDGFVIVLTDQHIAADDPRLMVVTPPPAQANVGITHVAAREKPAAQVMVRLDGSSASERTIVITSGDVRIERTIDATGTTFIDVPRLSDTVEVKITPGDALAADDHAWLVRERGWPRIEAIAALPPELGRMVETYGRLRIPRDDARIVSIVNAGDGPEDPTGAAVILALPEATAAGDAAPDVVDHPVTTAIAWPEVLGDARLASAAPAGFVPLVSVGGRVAVAIREGDERQVWIALDSPTFSRRADYVIFWTNVFDWLGGVNEGGGGAFASHTVGLLGQEWRRLTDGPDRTEPGLWPGIYQRSDGTLRAVNVSDAHLKPGVAPIQSDWRARLSRAVAARPAGRTLSPYLLLAALACALGSASQWPARRTAQT